MSERIYYRGLVDLCESIDDVEVIRQRDWTGLVLEEQSESYTGWRWINLDNETDADVRCEIELYDEFLSDVSLIIDRVAKWAAIVTAIGAVPGRPEDPVKGCFWSPDEVDDNDEGSEYARLQVACGRIWESLWPGVFTADGEDE